MKTSISLIVILSMSALYGSSYELNRATQELDKAGKDQAAQCLALCHALKRFSATGARLSDQDMMAHDLETLEQALQRELDAVRHMKVILPREVPSE